LIYYKGIVGVEHVDDYPRFIRLWVKEYSGSKGAIFIEDNKLLPMLKYWLIS
jgi:hypothetical protein